jgi:hypothetical protein
LAFETPDMLYYYNANVPTGDVYAEDSNLKIMTGVGKDGLFGSTFTSRQLNGAIIYYNP